MAESTQTEVLIRRAKRDDLPTVIALDQRVTGVGKPRYWEDVFERYGVQRPHDRYFLVAETTDGAHRYLGLIVGEVRAWEFGSPPCGWVFAIQVETDARQGYIGSRLFEAICEAFRAAGVSKVRTMTSTDNHLLLSFFRGQGMMGGPYLQLEMELRGMEAAQ